MTSRYLAKKSIGRSLSAIQQQTKKMAFSCFVCLFFLLITRGVNCDEDDTDDDDYEEDDHDDFSVLNCYKKAEPGICMAYIQRWYFNKTWNNCTKFIYGGCHGNENNFKSKHECEKKCRHAQGDSEHQSSTTDQQIPQGPCIKALKERQPNLLFLLMPNLHHLKYIPQCNRHGYYKRMQCNHSRKKCWCVDKWGNKKGKHNQGDPYELDCN